MIVDLQRKLMEIGRLRIGQQVTSNGKTRPAKLDTWRFTSANKSVIEQAAKLYGGTPKPWQAPSGPQTELISESTTLPVLVPPADLAFTQFYELWSAGGCARRCDGVTESISDGDCMCDPDNRECKIHSRLSVLLSNLAGLGVWRVETSGWYAARELSAAVDVIRLAASAGQMLPATLRLEQRMVKREGQTRRFAVPVLDIAVSPAQLLAGGRNFDPLDAGTVAIEPPRFEINSGPLTDPLKDPETRRILTPVPESVPERPVPSVAEQATTPKTRKPRKNAAQPIPATGLKPRTAVEAAAASAGAMTSMTPKQAADELVAETERLGLYDDPPPEGEPELIRPNQLKKLVILLREAGFGGDDRQARLDYCSAAVGRPITSSKELTVGEATRVIDSLENGEPA